MSAAADTVAAERIFADAAAEVWVADALNAEHVAAVMGERRADALITDPPYSERTHAGHDDGVAQANRAADYADRAEADGRTHQPGGVSIGRLRAYTAEHGAARRAFSYSSWTREDVHRFVLTWAPLTAGWSVSLTDHVLVTAWEAALQDAGRYVFAPLACVEPGSRVRLTGDGPANWACWAVVARPREREWAGWGSLPGAYVVPAGHGDTRTGRRDGDVRVVGGKPAWLMAALVRDYSRHWDLVVDPCCGGGTTGVAARILGRRFVGIDIDRGRAEMSAKRIAAAREQTVLAL